MNTRNIAITLIAIMVVAGGFFLINAAGPASQASAPDASAPDAVVQVVAAENFWGSLAEQIGGSHVHVHSIVVDPNADPHDYESTSNDARAVADADYVIENGAGYDSWMDKLIQSGGKRGRAVLDIGDVVGKKSGDNPHIWYSPSYVNQAAAQMEKDLIAIDPSNAAYYQNQYAALQASLAVYQNKIVDIGREFGGTNVGATEDIFVYLADAAGLHLTTPPEFIDAVAEGNDPSAASIATFENQIKSKQIEVLVYNVQTVTPTTENVKKLAQANHIPIVGISETMQPANAKFQDWMGSEISALQAALQETSGR